MEKLKHIAGLSHVYGTTEYIDDIPRQANELNVFIIESTIAKGKILSTNLKTVKEILQNKFNLSYQRDYFFFDGLDFTDNYWGAISCDQPILAQSIQYLGEPLFLFAANNVKIFKIFMSLFKIDYKQEIACLELEESIAKKNFLSDIQTINQGRSEYKTNNQTKTLEGSFFSAGQEHFYLESQAVIAYPDEQDSLVIRSSTQHPTEVQHVVSKALGLSFNQVVTKVKKLGGGFGGKESQASQIAACAALVAYKTKRPARLVLSKDQDMLITGKRHPFLSKYKVQFNSKGKILFLSADLYADAGAYLDLTPSILQRAMFHIDNAYKLKNVRLQGFICKTNKASNTAFRGFGGPQGAAIIEHIMQEISQVLRIDSFKIRRLNCYQENDKTHYGQKITNNFLPNLFDTIHKTSKYQKMRDIVNKYNKQDHNNIHGIAITASKFGISFTAKFLNQGSAIVNIHTDGTVQVSTGAIEMGQGVNTKIQIVVSEVLGINVEDIRIMPTSTEKNHNTSATAASSGSDINAHAAAIASQKIKTRLINHAIEIFKQKGLEHNSNLDTIYFKNSFVIFNEHKISFKELVQDAYLNRINLGDHGFYKTPNLNFDPKKGRGNPFLYFTNGTCFSKVSVDKYTGEVKVLESNILMDIGKSINLDIDRGQVAGAFIQALGWVTSENLVYNIEGRLLTISPTTYKIPSIQDVPRKFKIDFIKNETNTINIRQSKAVGEPPFLLAISVFAAIKDALSYIAPISQTSKLSIPATSQEILQCIYHQL